MTDHVQVSSPKAAFIIVCWNNQDLLQECFESIGQQAYAKHVTVMIDNGSKDDSIAFTRQKFPWVDVIDAGDNLGFAKGNNRAIKHALETYPSLEYVVLLNTDARVDPDWLQVMLEFADKKPKGALFQSMTLDYYDHEVVDSSHIYVSHNGSGTQAQWRQPYHGELGPRRVFGVNAAAAIISRRFMEDQPFKNLFDETLFMYLEDVDVAARATIIGWDCYVVPGTKAYHMGSASSGKNPGFSLYMTYRNNSALLLKNFPVSMLIRMLPQLVRSDIATVKALRRMDKEPAARKVIKGRFVGVCRLPLFLHKRIAVRRRAQIDNEYLWNLMRNGS